MVVLHTDRSQNRSHRTRCPSLLADHLANIGGGNAETQHCALFSFDRLNNYSLGNINQRSRNLSD